MTDDIGHASIDAINALLSDAPDNVAHHFSNATRLLTTWRDGLIARWRQTGAEVDRQRLDQVNAALSLIVGGQFSLGSIHWPKIEQLPHNLTNLVV